MNRPHIFIWDGGRGVCPNTFQEREPGCLVPFILIGAEFFRFAYPGQFKQTEIIQTGNFPSAKNLTGFLGKTFIAVRKVGDDGDGPVGKAQGYRDIIFPVDAAIR